jgi:signal-transduction protein with cAMP-binding, CBS, and nucleotidyltransferase domain
MSASLREAAETMRMADAGTVLISDERDRLTGILTDRDIAIRAVAEGLDPFSTRVGDISSPYPETVSPGTSVREAVKLMRQLDIRRLPVTEGGRPVGIVSLGDLAILQDPASALADISAAPSTDRPSEGTMLTSEADVVVLEVDAPSSAGADMFTEGPATRR